MNELWLTLDENARRKARRFHFFYCLVKILASPRAVYLYLLLHLRSPAGIVWLRDLRMIPWWVVCDICAARLVRKVQLITGWTASPAIIWPEKVPSSCVIAFFHSNWDMIIANEFARRDWCFISTHEGWARRLDTQYVSRKNVQLRHLVRRIDAGGRCGVAMDAIANLVNTPTSTSPGLRITPVRIAAIAGCPLVPVWPIFERGVLRLAAGKPIEVSKNDGDYEAALSHAGQFFESAMQQDPASWRSIFPYLMCLKNV